MAQFVTGAFSTGRRYIPDPRVQEAATLQSLALQRQQQQFGNQRAQDQLAFQREQALAGNQLRRDELAQRFYTDMLGLGVDKERARQNALKLALGQQADMRDYLLKQAREQREGRTAAANLAIDRADLARKIQEGRRLSPAEEARQRENVYQNLLDTFGGPEGAEEAFTQAQADADLFGMMGGPGAGVMTTQAEDLLGRVPPGMWAQALREAAGNRAEAASQEVDRRTAEAKLQGSGPEGTVATNRTIREAQAATQVATARETERNDMLDTYTMQDARDSGFTLTYPISGRMLTGADYMELARREAKDATSDLERERLKQQIKRTEQLLQGSPDDAVGASLVMQAVGDPESYSLGEFLRGGKPDSKDGIVFDALGLLADANDGQPATSEQAEVMARAIENAPTDPKQPEEKQRAAYKVLADKLRLQHLQILRSDPSFNRPEEEAAPKPPGAMEQAQQELYGTGGSASPGGAGGAGSVQSALPFGSAAASAVKDYERWEAQADLLERDPASLSPEAAEEAKKLRRKLYQADPATLPPRLRRRREELLSPPQQSPIRPMPGILPRQPERPVVPLQGRNPEEPDMIEGEVSSTAPAMIGQGMLAVPGVKPAIMGTGAFLQAGKRGLENLVTGLASPTQTQLMHQPLFPTGPEGAGFRQALGGLSDDQIRAELANRQQQTQRARELVAQGHQLAPELMPAEGMAPVGAVPPTNEPMRGFPQDYPGMGRGWPRGGVTTMPGEWDMDPTRLWQAALLTGAVGMSGVQAETGVGGLGEIQAFNTPMPRPMIRAQPGPIRQMGGLAPQEPPLTLRQVQAQSAQARAGAPNRFQQVAPSRSQQRLSLEQVADDVRRFRDTYGRSPNQQELDMFQRGLLPKPSTQPPIQAPQRAPAAPPAMREARIAPRADLPGPLGPGEIMRRAGALRQAARQRMATQEANTERVVRRATEGFGQNLDDAFEFRRAVGYMPSMEQLKWYQAAKQLKPGEPIPTPPANPARPYPNTEQVIDQLLRQSPRTSTNLRLAPGQPPRFTERVGGPQPGPARPAPEPPPLTRTGTPEPPGNLGGQVTNPRMPEIIRRQQQQRQLREVLFGRQTPARPRRQLGEQRNLFGEQRMLPPLTTPLPPGPQQFGGRTLALAPGLGLGLAAPQTPVWASLTELPGDLSRTVDEQGGFLEALARGYQATVGGLRSQRGPLGVIGDLLPGSGRPELRQAQPLKDYADMQSAAQRMARQAGLDQRSQRPRPQSTGPYRQATQSPEQLRAAEAMRQERAAWERSMREAIQRGTEASRRAIEEQQRRQREQERRERMKAEQEARRRAAINRQRELQRGR